jgi:hypothetical protein
MRVETRSTARARATRRKLAPWLVAGPLALLPSLGAQPSTPPPAIPVPQVWSGRMVVPEGVQPGLTADRFELKVFELSTDHEVADLARALRAGGQGALRDQMFRLKAKGWIQIGRLAATEVGVIRVADLPDGKRRLRLYSDRPLRLYDRSEPVGSMAHPFAFLELVVDSSGAGGTGSLVAAASLAIDEAGLHIDTAETPVVEIIEVTSDRPPARPAAP